MTALTRRPNDNPHQEGWHIYFGDVRVGSIRMLAGVPTHGDQWGWSLGFNPGMEVGPRGDYGGSAASFEEARAAFEAKWKTVEPTLTEDQFETWRRDRDFTAWKYRMWKEGCQLPTQTRSGEARCFCGASITNADIEAHIQAAHRGIGA